MTRLLQIFVQAQVLLSVGWNVFCVSWTKRFEIYASKVHASATTLSNALGK
jgi:hypothetical protein